MKQECPYKLICKFEECPERFECLYKSILDRQVFKSRINKRIYREEHGHHRWEEFKYG